MRDWLRRRPGLAFVLLSAALTVAGEVLVWWGTGYLPPVDSTQGTVVDDAIIVLAYLVVPVFAGMTLLLVFAGTVWRVRAEDTADSERQLRSHRRVTLGWLGGTSGLAALVIIYPGVTGIRQLAATSHTTPATLVVDVTAQQWEWSFAYPQYHVKYSRTLVLPVDRRVEFVLRSKDVIHSFWIPSMRVKKDVIPGETRVLYLTPDRLTSTRTDPMTRLQCAELCGIGHSQMRATVRVVPAGQFTAWAARQATVSPPMG